MTHRPTKISLKVKRDLAEVNKPIHCARRIGIPEKKNYIFERNFDVFLTSEKEIRELGLIKMGHMVTAYQITFFISNTPK